MCKGYIGEKLNEKSAEKGMDLVTTVGNNIKVRVISVFEGGYYQRNIIETINELLKSIS